MSYFERPVESYEFLPKKGNGKPLFGGIGITSGGSILEKYFSELGGVNFLIKQYEHMIDVTIGNFLSSLSYVSENNLNKIVFKNFRLETPVDPDNQNMKLYTSSAKRKSVSYSGQSYIDIVTIDSEGKILSEENVKFAKFPVIKGCKYDNDTYLSDEEKLRRNIDPDGANGYFIINGNSRYIYTSNNKSSNRFMVNMNGKFSVYDCSIIYEFDSGITIKHDLKEKNQIFYLSGKEGLFFNFLYVLTEIGKKTQVKWEKGYEFKYKISDIYSTGKEGEKLSKIIPKPGETVWASNNDQEQNIEMIINDICVYLDEENILEAKNLLIPSINNLREIEDKRSDYEDNIFDATEHAKLPVKYFTSPNESDNDVYDFTINSTYNNMIYMIAKLLDHKINEKVDDLDIYSNKKMKTSVRELLSSFITGWTQGITVRGKGINQNSKIPNNTRRLEALSEFLTASMESTFSLNSKKTEIDVKQFTTLTKQGMLSELRTCDSPLSKLVKQLSKRGIVRDQAPYICVGEATDGNRLGLVRSLSLNSSISVGYNYYITEYIQQLKSQLNLYKKKNRSNRPIFVNGFIIGFEKVPHDFEEGIFAESEVGTYFRNLRRNGTIPELSCVITRKLVNISTYSDRLLAPFLIVDKDQKLSLTREDITNLEKGKINLNHLMEKGVIEMIDPYEMDTNCKYASSPEDLARQVKKRDTLFRNLNSSKSLSRTKTEIIFELKGIDHYTHTLTSFYSFTSISVSHISHADATIFNRVIGQSRKGVQAIGDPIRFAELEGIKSSALAYPEISTSLTEGEVIQKVFNEGRNLLAAFITYGGENSEDSIIVNEVLRDMGAFRTATTFQVSQTFTQKGSNIVSDMGLPRKSKKSSSEYWLCKPKGYIYKNLTEEGLPKTGSIIRKGDPLIGGISESNGERKISPYIFREAKEAKVLYSTVEMEKEGKYKVTVTLSKINIGCYGDKLVSDWSQKFTIVYKSRIDMPFFTMNGQNYIVDIVINARSVIARDTQAWLWNIMSNLFGLEYGEFQDATSGKAFNIDKYVNFLASKGFNNTMVDIYDGISGEISDAKVFVGPSFFTVNKHVTGEKQLVRSEGNRDALTGVSKKGPKEGQQSIKYPEQVVDVVISQGIANAPFVDDAAYINVCSRCSSPFFIHSKDEEKYCTHCPGAPVTMMKTSTSRLYNQISLLRADLIETQIIEGSQPREPYKEPSEESEEFISSEELDVLPPLDNSDWAISKEDSSEDEEYSDDMWNDR